MVAINDKAAVVYIWEFISAIKTAGISV